MTAQQQALVTSPRIAHRGRGTTLVLLSSACFGSSGPLAKPAMSAGFSPEQVATLRIGLAAVLLLAGVAVSRPALLRVRRDQLGLLAGYGLLGVGGVQLCYFAAVARLPVGIALVLDYTSPVLVALWVWLVRSVRISRTSWLGTALALLGLMLVAQVWQGLRLDAVGLLAGLGTAVCSSAYFLLGERAADRYHPLGLVTWGMVIGALALFVIAPPWTVPVAALGDHVAFGPWDPPVWTLLVAVAVLSTALPYLFGITALRHLPSTVASVVGMFEAVVATVLAWLLLDEALTAMQLTGMVVLLGGAAVVQLASRRPQPGPAPMP